MSRDIDKAELVGKSIDDVEYHADYYTPFIVTLDDGTTMMVATWSVPDEDTSDVSDNNQK